MSVVLNGSSQYLLNSAPVLSALPFSFGCWVQPFSVSAGNHVVLDVASVADEWAYMRVAATWGIYPPAGTSVVTFGTVVAGRWYYVIGRSSAATNHRMAVLDELGATAHGQSTQGSTITPSKLGIGAGIVSTPISFFDGHIAEFWLTNTDIQPGGLQLTDALLRQLAYRGPFSVPHVRQNLVDYRSLRQSLGSATDRARDYVPGRFGRQIWTTPVAVDSGPHPALLSGYRGPAGSRGARIIPV